MRIKATLLLGFALLLARDGFAQQEKKSEPRNFSGVWLLDREKSRNWIFESVVEGHLKQYKDASLKTTDATTLTILHAGAKFSLTERTVVEVFSPNGKLTKRYPIYDASREMAIDGATERNTYSDERKTERHVRWAGDRLRVTTKTSRFDRKFASGSGGLKFQFTTEVLEETCSLSPDGNELTIEVVNRVENPARVNRGSSVKNVYRKIG